MKRYFVFLIIAISCLVGAPVGANPSGTKGQNYDRIVLESQTDDAVELLASVMTINRYADSSSAVVVTDNGTQVFGPESETSERWKRPFTIRGKGRHDVVMTCASTNSEPVHCALIADDRRVSVLQ